jgi:hypothetical protein
MISLSIFKLAHTQTALAVFLIFNFNLASISMYGEPQSEKQNELEFDDLKEVHITSAYMYKIPITPTNIGGLNGTIIIQIKEWPPGQDNQKAIRFSKNAPKKFILKSQGRPDVIATLAWLSEPGYLQGFLLIVIPNELQKMVREVPYTLNPTTTTGPSRWIVAEKVQVTRPALVDEILTEIHGWEWMYFTIGCAFGLIILVILIIMVSKSRLRRT